MNTKSFWVEGEERLWASSTPAPTNVSTAHPTTGYGGGYQTYNYDYGTTGGYSGYTQTYTPTWAPYKTKFPDSRTEVTFHLLFDPRVLQEADRVFIIGNLTEMVNESTLNYVRA
jgi:hypothetical protein